MPLYAVAYDLYKQGQNYDCLIKKFEAFNRCHNQQSLWFVECAGTAAQLRDHLQSCLDQNETLIVDRVSDEWAGHGMLVCDKWLTCSLARSQSRPPREWAPRT